MKNHFTFFCLLIAFIFQAVNASSQSAPVWTHDLNTLPDSAYLFPVKVEHDGNNNIYVLSTYMKTMSPTVTLNKIYLYKYDYTGALAWSLIYDHNGTGQPRGFDMAIDNNGDCYVAGGLMDVSGFKPLLVKINSGGSVVWDRDSTLEFNFSNYDQIIFAHNQLYVKATYGIATFTLNGNEIWSHNMAIERMAVDNKGQIIFSAYLGNPNSIFRYDSAGVINFVDSAIVAKRIAVDADNSFYLLSDMTNYALVKYDSAGNYKWGKSSFPAAPPFGDIGFDVLIDYNNDVIVVGLSDTMFKFDSNGNQIWAKPMNGLDSYMIDAKITYSNLIAVAGSVPDLTGYAMKVATYDLNGNQNWWGYYDGISGLQEYTVGLTIDNSGVYAIENNNNNTTVVKFDSFFGAPVDYSLVCVDSVWYDANNPNFINVTLFNGNVSSMNYPSVQIVSPTGDTIGNPDNDVSFFAHLENIYLTYQDTITVLGITDFSNYTFLVSEGFGDTTVEIHWCNATGVMETENYQYNIYPNPVHDYLTLENNFIGNHFDIAIYNCLGAKVIAEEFANSTLNKIDVSELNNGVYFLLVMNGNILQRMKFIKQ